MSASEHKFEVGQIVLYASGSTLPQERKNATIVKLLPPLGTILQYRIRSDKESYDRVVLETALG